MPTIICKRISTDGIPEGGQWAYNRNLTKYMANPESKTGAEKCFATFSGGFTRSDLTPEEIACEFTMDCDLVPALRSSGVDHWVMSFSETKRKIPIPKIKSAVHGWIVDMGYAGFHKFFAAVHKDTDNLHVHIALCRINALTGKVKERGFWKNQNQLAITRVAKAEKWSLEDGSDKFICPSNTRPEPVIIHDPVFGTSHTIWRPCVIPVSSWKSIFVLDKNQVQEPDTKKMPFPGDKASRFEHFTGLKSNKSYLIEKLAEVLDELPESPQWLDVHASLAKRGILMELQKHKNGHYGLVFSRDGKNFHAPRKVCPQLSWNVLSVRINEPWAPANQGNFEKYNDFPVRHEAMKETQNIVSIREKAQVTKIATKTENKNMNTATTESLSNNWQNRNDCQEASSAIIRPVLFKCLHEEKMRLYCLSRMQAAAWGKPMGEKTQKYVLNPANQPELNKVSKPVKSEKPKQNKISGSRP